MEEEEDEMIARAHHHHLASSEGPAEVGEKRASYSPLPQHSYVEVFFIKIVNHSAKTRDFNDPLSLFIHPHRNATKHIN